MTWKPFALGTLVLGSLCLAIPGLPHAGILVVDPDKARVAIETTLRVTSCVRTLLDDERRQLADPDGWRSAATIATRCPTLTPEDQQAVQVQLATFALPPTLPAPTHLKQEEWR